jgi:hypothetical protein
VIFVCFLCIVHKEGSLEIYYYIFSLRVYKNDLLFPVADFISHAIINMFREGRQAMCSIFFVDI